MAKRKRSSVSAAVVSPEVSQLPTGRGSSRRAAHATPIIQDTNPDTNGHIEDGPAAIRASPDSEKLDIENGTGKKRKRAVPSTALKVEEGLLEANEQIDEKSRSSSSLQNTSKPDDGMDRGDPEADGDEDADPEELKDALSRPPPVNSSYLPLPWKGRLGYACLNTYLRSSNPPVFSSRTCRIASILEHRHPLKDPSQPEHATKNRPDKDQPADIARGQAYVEALGLANARDIIKMLRWNDRYGIKFLRLSSEMFPFASHDVYGYTLAPFASEALAEAGRVAAKLGHRLTTHPGQFTQLGSPRKEVINASICDLEYHCELLDLLKLPEQQNRDAVMILHMGGVFGDKAATIARFRENYGKLHQGIKNRLVLENDDVSYSVHDLLPVCEELNIPLVLDYHHHNIIFEADKLREGTLDIMALYDRIKATWTRKKITQKMHYSEPTPSAITARQRRKHSPRVAVLPPCAQDMDLMIEAKDKEQAVFELMRTFKLPGFDTFNNIVPHVRPDENRPWKAPKKKSGTPKKKKASDVNGDVDLDDGSAAADAEPQPPPLIPESEVGMGGPEGRVYWPPGMEEWLRPKKREVKPRDPEKTKTTSERAALRRAEKAAWQAAQEAGGSTEEVSEMADTPGKSVTGKENDIAKTKKEPGSQQTANGRGVLAKAKPKSKPKATKAAKRAAPAWDVVSDQEEEEEDDEQDVSMPDLTDADESAPAAIVRSNKRAVQPARASSGRRAKMKTVNYAVDTDEEQE